MHSPWQSCIVLRLGIATLHLLWQSDLALATWQSDLHLQLGRATCNLNYLQRLDKTRLKVIFDVVCMHSTRPKHVWQQACGFACSACTFQRALHAGGVCVLCQPTRDGSTCPSCAASREADICTACRRVAAQLAAFEAVQVFRGYHMVDGLADAEAWECMRCRHAVVSGTLVAGRARDLARLLACKTHAAVCPALVPLTLQVRGERGHETAESHV
jgi:hypothetical protein